MGFQWKPRLVEVQRREQLVRCPSTAFGYRVIIEDTHRAHPRSFRRRIAHGSCALSAHVDVGHKTSLVRVPTYGRPLRWSDPYLSPACSLRAAEPPEPAAGGAGVIRLLGTEPCI